MKINQYTKDELFQIAFFDLQTNHYNWTWMQDRIYNSKKYGINEFYLIHFNIKDFNLINELYDINTSNNLLCKIANVLKELDWCYCSCKCYNDNFAIMSPIMTKDDLVNKLNNLFDTISTLDEDYNYHVFYRAGIAEVNHNILNEEHINIIDMAKLAQSLGVNANMNDINFYTEEMKTEEFKGKLLKNELDRAFAHNEFLVYYQPKYDAKTNIIVGAEALIRWHYNHQELWTPYKFVPYLEKENVISKIDLFVLEEVCKNLENWKKLNYKLIPISVNMSKTQLYNTNTIDQILNIVNKYDIDKKYIEFELTESSAYEDVNYMLNVMNKLRNEGFLLSIDDFGTGYSSLNLLSTMPITGLKIDKSFIDELEKSNSKSKIKYIIKDIINMAKHLRITSIAEGVETENQKNLISNWGCNTIQGYYYSKPLPINEFELLIS